MGFVYSSGRKSQFQLCLRFFICLIWFICHLSSLQRHFIMVSFLMSIYLSANTPSVLDCSHFRDIVRDSWMPFPFWRFKSAKSVFIYLFIIIVVVDVRIYGCHLPIWHWSINSTSLLHIDLWKLNFHYLEREWGSLVEHIVIACLSFFTGCDYIWSHLGRKVPSKPGRKRPRRRYKSCFLFPTLGTFLRTKVSCQFTIVGIAKMLLQNGKLFLLIFFALFFLIFFVFV